MCNYKYLFPFEKIPPKCKIVIYGGGEVGWEYIRQLVITNYADIVGVVDRRADDMERLPVKIFSPEQLEQIDFDYIVLAFKSRTYFEKVSSDLKKRGIDETRIVYVPQRIEPDYEISMEYDRLNHEKTIYAYEMDCVSVAIKIGSAIGDNIIQKKFIAALAKLNPSLKIDIYSPIANSFLPWMYSDLQNINVFIQDAGSLYAQNYSKYDLSLNIWVMISIDYINEIKLKNEYVDFYHKIKVIENKIIETDMNYHMPMYNFYARAIKQGKNAYTVYNFDGVMDIQDQRVHISLDDSFLQNFKKLGLPLKYVTINYGNRVAMQASQTVAKQWPLECFEDFARSFSKEFSDIKIVQLGAEDACFLKNVDEYVIGKPLELVAHVLKNSLLHIDIEGGLVHLATQLGTKCVVLFGPTQELYFGYKQNINIKAGTCHEMYLDYTKCARHMDRPECMYNITPKMVLEKVKEYFGR